MNLKEIGEFKNKVISKLIHDDNVVDVLIGKNKNKDNKEELLLGIDETGKNGCVFKFEYVPDTQEMSKTFLCVEVIPDKTNGGSVTDMYLYIFIYCSKDIMQTYHRNQSSGTRIDILASDVDRILNGNSDFGIGPLEWDSSNIYKPAQIYYGRVLVYSVSAFRRQK